MLTIQVKNTTLHLNGQNLRLTAKNGHSSKTPGPHLSAAQGKEAIGRLMASPLTQLQTPRPDLHREAEGQPVRRPLKLAPLELPEEVREAQRQKLQLVQQEAKRATCKPAERVNEARTSKVKSCVTQGQVKSIVWPSASTEPLKVQQQNRISRLQLSRSKLKEPNGDRHLGDVVCRGTPAPLCSKPAPLLPSPRAKAQAGCAGEATCQNLSTPQQGTQKTQLRFRRAKCLEEDRCSSNTSTGGLSAEEGKLVRGVQAKEQRAESALRGQPHSAEGIKEAPAASWEQGRVRESQKEGCILQSAKCTLERPSGEAGRSEQALDGVKLSASNGRLKRKKTLITKHNNACPTVIK